MSLKSFLWTASLGFGIMAQAAIVMPVQAQGQLNMICGHPLDLCDTITREFSAATGIDVSFIRMSGGEAYARIRAEARNPKVDVWYTGPQEMFYQAADENLTQSYQSPQIDNLIPLAQKMAQETDYKAMAQGVGIIGFSYNTETLKAKNLEPPKCWADLLRPEYKQEIALSNPNTAGTGNSILVALVELMGEDAAFDYLKKLNPNISSYTKSGSAVGSQAARGEVSIGVLFLHDANNLIRQGFPLENVIPCEGTGYALDSLSIIKGARNLQQAQIFVDWVLTPEAQSINIANGLNSYPTAQGATLSDYTVGIDGAKLLDIDPRRYGAPDMRKHLLSRWDREIGAIAGQ